MSWTVFNDAARSADQSRAVNERRALIDRLIGHADFYRPGSRQPREGVRFVYVLLRRRARETQHNRCGASDSRG